MEEDLNREVKMVADEDKNGAEAEHGDDEADKGTHKQIHILPPNEYIAPPEVATSPTSSDVALASRGEDIVGGTNQFSPYTFDKSRSAPPCCTLHDIRPPKNPHVSGFAKHLRWAFVQRAYYTGVRQVEGWNESPAHMERIRQTQVWASDELVAYVSRLQEEEKKEAERFVRWFGVRS
jgi:hypothetical protein